MPEMYRNCGEDCTHFGGPYLVVSGHNLVLIDSRTDPRSHLTSPFCLVHNGCARGIHALYNNAREKALVSLLSFESVCAHTCIFASSFIFHSRFWFETLSSAFCSSVLVACLIGSICILLSTYCYNGQSFYGKWHRVFIWNTATGKGMFTLQVSPIFQQTSVPQFPGAYTLFPVENGKWYFCPPLLIYCQLAS
jgi:hypothetical protein